MGTEQRKTEVDRKVAIVTGGSTGIGRAIAIRLSEEEFSIVVCSLRDERAGRAVASDINASGGEACYLRKDVSSREGSDAVVEHALQAFGKPTVLVNNAGATRGVDFGSWTVEHWQDMIATNLLTAAMMTQSFAAQLMPQDRGAIVNIASTRGMTASARPGIAAYCAAKAGVINLTESLAPQLGPNITINCVSPGLVDTDYVKRADSRLVNEWLREIPIRRLVDPTEVAELVLYLVSQSAISGANFVIDGGWRVSTSSVKEQTICDL